MVAAAIGASAAAGLAGSAISSSAAGDAAQMQADAATQAAQIQAQASNHAVDVQKQMFDTTQKNLAPWMSTGQNALTSLQSLLGLPSTTFDQAGYDAATAKYNSDLAASGGTASIPSLANGGIPSFFGGDILYGTGAFPALPGRPAPPPAPDRNAFYKTTPGDPLNSPLLRPFSAADFKASPGYQWQLDQGIDAIQNSAAARGGIGGNALKELMTYGQGLANQDWWNSYNAFTQNQSRTLNALTGVSGSGQNAAANLGSLGTQTAGQIGSALIGGANAQANGLIGAANANAAGLVGGANALSGALGGVGQSAFLYSMLNQGGGGGNWNWASPIADVVNNSGGWFPTNG